MTYSRRKFLGTALTAGASGLIAHASTQTAATEPDLLRLESDSLLVSIDRQSGCIHRIDSKDSAWKLQEAGMRLHVPAPDHRFHFLTEKQAGAPRIESDGSQATITWAGFESDRLGKLAIEVRQSVRLVGSGVHFSYEIRNGSSAVIESYTYPRLKGLKPPGGDKAMRQVAAAYSGMGSSSGAKTCSSNQVYTISSNQHWDSLTICNSATVQISGNVTILVEGNVTLNTSSNTGMCIEVLSGSSLTLYHKGSLLIENYSANIVDGQNLSRLKFVNLGSCPVTCQDYSATMGVIMSPCADVTYKGNCHHFGVCIGRSMTMCDSSQFHEDSRITNQTDPVSVPVPLKASTWVRSVQ